MAHYHHFLNLLLYTVYSSIRKINTTTTQTLDLRLTKRYYKLFQTCYLLFRHPVCPKIFINTFIIKKAWKKSLLFQCKNVLHLCKCWLLLFLLDILPKFVGTELHLRILLCDFVSFWLQWLNFEICSSCSKLSICVQ